MAKRLVTDPIRSDARKEKARRRAAGRTCERCGENRPEALVLRSQPVTCEECRRKGRGLHPHDAHHVAGKSNSALTIDIPANDHRARLSVDQLEWPKTTLQNPDGSPLIATAALLRGFADVCTYLLDSIVLYAASLLEQLDTYLRDRNGARWWSGTPIAAWAPEGH